MRDKVISSLTLPSPFYRLDLLSNLWNVDLWVKRDDLIPQYLGGNKVRKNFAILSSVLEKGNVPDVLITNGAAESNHARVVALMGAQLGCEVQLVLHGEKPQACSMTNSFFYVSAGANVHYVSSSEIASTIDNLRQGITKSGKTFLVIPGGAHLSVGMSAFAEAVAELTFEPDYIVHASGTGGTQAGLLTGVEQRGWKSKIIGISVARNKEAGSKGITSLLRSSFPSDLVDFRDEYRFGGYERCNSELLSFMRSVIRAEGIPLDTTYTGKAMFGLSQLVRIGEIVPGSRVVFWHTGGFSSSTSLNP